MQKLVMILCFKFYYRLLYCFIKKFKYLGNSEFSVNPLTEILININNLTK
jgi:hypothetical protein